MKNVLRRGKSAVGLAAIGLLGNVLAPAAGHAQDTQSSSGLEEVVVTAQRREENLQTVPIAVTAVSADAMQRSGISATNALPQIVPSVQMTRSGPAGLFFIRGVGTSNAGAGEEGANAIYLDGVYLGDLGQVITNFNNVERVEVLKGPQGTLFGRNATGGLIHIITREPGDKLVAQGQIGYANYQKVSGQLYVSGPVSEKVSADIAFTAADQRDGWGRNLTLGTRNQTQEYWGVRSKVVFRATDKLKITLSGDYNRDDDSLGLAWRIADGVIGTGGVVGPSGHNTTSNTPALTKLSIWGASMTVEADLNFATLTSISATRGTRNDTSFDVDGGPVNLVNLHYVNKIRTYQEELRLASNTTEPLSWQVGGFYLRSLTSNVQDQNGLAFAPAGLRNIYIFGDLATDSYAVFGEATYAIFPKTKLTAGVRYTMDRRDFSGGQTPFTLAGAGLATSTIAGKLSYNEPTYHVALRQDIADGINAYFSFNRGFKAGSYTLQSPFSAPVKPQFINAYELGVKSELFDRKLRVNIAGYHYDIDDYQARSAAIATGTLVLLNAATVKVDGLDVEFQAAPTNAWNVFGGFTVLNSRFGKFGGDPVATTPQAPIVYPNPATCPANLKGTKNPGVLGAGPRTGGFTTCFGDVSGNRTALAPKFTASLGTSYTIPVGADGDVRLSALYSHNSGYVFDVDNVRRQGAFDLLNASLEYRPAQHYAVEFWANNITNAVYSVQDLTTGTGTTVALGPPRTFGANLKFDF